jgi:hypothetical protein
MAARADEGSRIESKKRKKRGVVRGAPDAK